METKKKTETRSDVARVLLALAVLALVAALDESRAPVAETAPLAAAAR